MVEMLKLGGRWEEGGGNASCWQGLAGPHLEEPQTWIPNAFIFLVFQAGSISNMLKKLT